MAYRESLFFFGVVIVIVVGSHCSFHFLTARSLSLSSLSLDSNHLSFPDQLSSLFSSLVHHRSSSLIALVRSVLSSSHPFTSLAH